MRLFSARRRLPLSTTLIALGLGACSSLTNNVAIKDLDRLRAEQNTCLATNARQMDDRTSDAGKVAREVATACRNATERLVAHALTHPSPQERRAFEEDAEVRAGGYVKLGRSGSI